MFYNLLQKMHVDFDPLKVDWSTSGDGGESTIQFGGAAYAVFKGYPYQRGGGIGSVLRSFMMRYLIPIGKEIGTAVGRQGLESGSNVLTNVLAGKDLKESLVTEGKAGLKNLLEKAARNVDVQRQKQKGEGGSFDFKRYRKSNINKIASTIGPQNLLPGKRKGRKQKRLRVDALGTY